jgi:hypothetical protein
MRLLMPALAALLALAACVDFGLDERRYRCLEDPEICGDGWACNGYGYCAPEGDADPHAVDADPSAPDAQLCSPGEGECDDGNLCTISRCSATTGTCEHTPRRCDAPGFQCCPEDGTCRAAC